MPYLRKKKNLYFMSLITLLNLDPNFNELDSVQLVMVVDLVHGIQVM